MSDKWRLRRGVLGGDGGTGPPKTRCGAAPLARKDPALSMRFLELQTTISNIIRKSQHEKTYQNGNNTESELHLWSERRIIFIFNYQLKKLSVNNQRGPHRNSTLHLPKIIC